MDADPGYHPQEDDQVDADMEQAQLRLEQLRKEKEEVESSRRRLEETHLRKARFMDQQNELGDRMVNAADSAPACSTPRCLRACAVTASCASAPVNS